MSATGYLGGAEFLQALHCFLEPPCNLVDSWKHQPQPRALPWAQTAAGDPHLAESKTHFPCLPHNSPLPWGMSQPLLASQTPWNAASFENGNLASRIPPAQTQSIRGHALPFSLQDCGGQWWPGASRQTTGEMEEQSQWEQGFLSGF